MADQLTMTYNIIGYNKIELLKLVQKLNRRAKKYNLQPIDMVFGTPYFVQIDEIKRREMIPVTLIGPSPKVNGWTFVATLQHSDVGNIIRTVPGIEENLPDEFRHSDPSRCDSCGIRRYRIDTYVIHHDDGRWMQVGSSCLQDFVSSLDAHHVAELAQTWSLISEAIVAMSDEDGFGYGGRESEYLDLEWAIAWAYEATTRFGWTSRSKAKDNPELYATVDSALDAMSVQGKPCVYSCHFDKQDRCTKHWEPDEKAHDKAVEILAWAEPWIEKRIERAYRDGVDVPDYVWNLKVSLASDAMPIRSYGLAASVIGVWLREQERLAEERRNAADSTSEWVGPIGKRQDFTLVLDSTRPIEGQFMPTTVMNFHDNSGNVYVWFASGFQQPNLGRSYKVKGTIKNHTEYRGVKQTVLTRCKMVEV